MLVTAHLLLVPSIASRFLSLLPCLLSSQSAESLKEVRRLNKLLAALEAASAGELVFVAVLLLSSLSMTQCLLLNYKAPGFTMVLMLMRSHAPVCFACTGDPSALLRDTEDGANGFPSAAATLAASRARSAAAPAPGAAQSANATKVNLTEVRLQLQRQLKQQVGPCGKAVRLQELVWVQ